MHDIQQIILECCKNSRRAQKELFDMFAPYMLGVCMRYAKNRAEAEDIIQEAFVKIFLNIKNYTATGSFEGWMRKVVVNTAITCYRQNLKYLFIENIENINEKEVENNNEEVENEYSEEQLLKIINSLPDGYRVIFNLYAIEGYKHKEISEILNIDENTSKSQFSRARKMIQQKLFQLSDKKIKIEEI